MALRLVVKAEAALFVPMCGFAPGCDESGVRFQHRALLAAGHQL